MRTTFSADSTDNPFSQRLQSAIGTICLAGSQETVSSCASRRLSFAFKISYAFPFHSVHFHS